MGEQCIRVRNLTKSFGNRKVVDDLSFDVKKGEVFALLGHNGAGKSTTIKLILDLVKEGFGVSFVYHVLADSDPQIEKFSIQGEPIVREFSLVHLKHTDVQDKIDLFFEEMPLTQKPADT